MLVALRIPIPMDLLALAVPFFLLALIIEMIADRALATGYFRVNDAINSLSAGTLSTTFGYFSRFFPATIWAFILQDFSIFDIDPGAFNFSPAGLLNWVIALVAFDFCYYWRHRCGHEISILWAAHAVHHQSEDYNLSTALRQTSSGFLFTWIFYLPLFVLGMPLEVFITVNTLDLIYQFWVHTQHIRRLGWADKVFVTPSNHRVHHAQNEIYIDRNYGGILILWDRLFGSFQEELDQEPVVFGVRKPLQSWNPFWANWQVYDYLLFDARRTRRWRDKIGVWFRRTGWRPADVLAEFPKPKSDLASFRKYDPGVFPGIRRYVLMQFLLAVIAVLWIGRLYASHGAIAVALPCVLLWLQLYSIGQLNEARPGAPRLEVFRLLIAMPVGLYATLMLPDTRLPVTTAWLAFALYATISLYLLLRAWRNGNYPTPAKQ